MQSGEHCICDSDMIAREGSKEYLGSFITVELLNLLNPPWKFISESHFLSVQQNCLTLLLMYLK